MAGLELRPNFGGGSGHPIAEMQGTPGWYSEDENEFKSKLADTKNWWYHASADLLYSIVGARGFMEYGVNRQDFASIRVTWEHVTWTNEHLNADGSVTVDVTIDIGYFGGHPTDYAGTVKIPVINSLLFNGQTIASRSGATIDGFFINPDPKTFHVTSTIPPESLGDNMNLVYRSVYPDHTFPDADINVGFALYNPNPPTYIPMSTRKGGSWKTLNDNNGHILIRKSGSWVNKSQENLNSQREPNKGHNRIRRNGEWLQLPKM